MESSPPSPNYWASFFIIRLHVIVSTGKVKKVVEDNKVRKKKSPDIKVAYLTLVSELFQIKFRMFFLSGFVAERGETFPMHIERSY